MNLKGKLLLRKAKTVDGKDILILAGNFFTSKEEFDKIDSCDEFWICNVEIREAIKFTDPVQNFAIEDFLTGEFQDKKLWRRRL